MTRRSPQPSERQLDPDRTREALLDAALEQFAEKGYEGARTADIAGTAGVNKQLINYHFGGKAGLHEALRQRWLEGERHIDTPDTTFAERMVGYVEAALAQPRMVRMALWSSLAGTNEADTWGVGEDVERLHAEQTDGRVRAELDPATLQLVAMGAVLAPVALGDSVRELFGVSADDPAFAERYVAGLRALLAALER